MRRHFALSFLITSVLLSSLAQLIFRYVMYQFAGAEVEFGPAIFALTGNAGPIAVALLAGGIALYGLSMVAWVLALSRFAVSQAYPAMSISYVIVYFGAIAVPALDESMTLSSLIGTAMIVIGVIFVSLEKKDSRFEEATIKSKTK